MNFWWTMGSFAVVSLSVPACADRDSDGGSPDEGMGGADPRDPSDPAESTGGSPGPSSGGRESGDPGTGGAVGTGGGTVGMGGGTVGMGGDTVGMGGAMGLGGAPVEPPEPPEDLINPTLDDVINASCRVRVDYNDDGTIEERWGYKKSAGGSLEREWYWEASDYTEDDPSQGVTYAVAYDSEGRPTWACQFGSCSQFTYLDEVAHSPECEDPRTLGSEVAVTRVLAFYPGTIISSEEHWLYDEEGRLVEAQVLEHDDEEYTSEEVRCFSESGVLARRRVSEDWSGDGYQFVQRYYPDGSLDSWNERAEFFDVVTSGRWCNAQGWTTRVYDNEYENENETRESESRFEYVVEDERVVSGQRRDWFDDSYDTSAELTELSMSYPGDGTVVVTATGESVVVTEYLLDPTHREYEEYEEGSRRTIVVRFDSLVEGEGRVDRYVYEGACAGDNGPLLETGAQRHPVTRPFEWLFGTATFGCRVYNPDIPPWPDF